MFNKNLLLIALFVSAVCLVNSPSICLAQAADNTAINRKDKHPDQMTAGQQSQTKEDREITQNIRQAVIDDKSLSTYAGNVKIITVDGMVTLKGPVRSEHEKSAIEEIVAQIVGKDKIQSEIEIAPKNKGNQKGG